MFFLSNHKGQPLWCVHLPDGWGLSAASNQILHHWIGASHTLSKIPLSGRIKEKKKSQKPYFALYLESVLCGFKGTESKTNKKLSEESNGKLKTAPCPWAMCFALSLWCWSEGKERTGPSSPRSCTERGRKGLEEDMAGAGTRVMKEKGGGAREKWGQLKIFIRNAMC